MGESPTQDVPRGVVAIGLGTLLVVVVLGFVMWKYSWEPPATTTTTPPPVDARKTAIVELPFDGSAEFPAPSPADPETKELLARTKLTDTAYIKHVLIGWVELAPTYRGHMDPRAEKRTKLEAGVLALDVLAKVQLKPGEIDALIKDVGEDPGAKSLEPYKVDEKSAFVPEFKSLALRLAETEVGIVKTSFGYHVMLRIAPPALDPIESADILGRSKKTVIAEVQHVLIGWKDLPAAKDPRAARRDRSQAATVATEIADRIKAGEDVPKLMKTFSEDPGTSATGASYSITEDEVMVEGFIALAMRLDVGEVGIVKTEFGFHVVKRLANDPINSSAVLTRPIALASAKVKFVLLGYAGANSGDPRGVTRTRDQLDQLVHDTKAKLDRGASIEELMKALSEDKGSAATGVAYDMTTPQVFPLLKMLGTRLAVGEVGMVKTHAGVFVTKRVE